jgi:hypothetical protein
MKGRGRLFIEKIHHQLPDRAAYVRWSVHVGPKSVSYVQVLPKGYTKSSVRPVVPRTSGVLFQSICPVVPHHTSTLQTEAYVRTTNKTVRPLDQAYIR